MRDVSRSADVDGEQQLSHDEQVMRDMRNIDIGMDDGFVKFLVFKLFNRLSIIIYHLSHYSPPPPLALRSNNEASSSPITLIIP